MALEASGSRVLHFKVSACRHFLATGQMEHEAAGILMKIAAPMKKSGGYRQLIQLIKPLFGRVSGRERWLDYHCAHCQFIVGDFQDALDATEELIHCDLSDDVTLRLAVCRLYAEILGATGNSRHGEVVLANAIKATDLSRVRGVGARQALTALGGLEFRNGRVASAKARFNQCFDCAEQMSDEYGMAIPLVWLGMIDLCEGAASSAFEKLHRAAGMFEMELDERGRAWAQAHAAEALLALGKQQEAVKYLRSSLQIYSDMDVRDVWLREQLERLVTRHDLGDELRELVTEALEGFRGSPRLRSKMLSTSYDN
jgi:tetratricopeptide (TPR) repeat protein